IMRWWRGPYMRVIPPGAAAARDDQIVTTCRWSAENGVRGLGRSEIPLPLRAGDDHVQTLAKRLHPEERLVLLLGGHIEKVIDVKARQASKVLSRSRAPACTWLEPRCHCAKISGARLALGPDDFECFGLRRCAVCLRDDFLHFGRRHPGFRRKRRYLFEDWSESRCVKRGARAVGQHADEPILDALVSRARPELRLGDPP